MSMQKIAITMEKQLVDRIDRLVATNVFKPQQGYTGSR